MFTNRLRTVFPIMLMMAIGLGFMLLGPLSSSAQGSDDSKSYPERLAGHEVLGVRDSDNTSCYAKTVPLFVLKSTETSANNLMASDDFDMDAIKQAIVDEGHPEDSEIIIAGPSSSKKRSSRSKWNGTPSAMKGVASDLAAIRTPRTPQLHRM